MMIRTSVISRKGVRYFFKDGFRDNSSLEFAYRILLSFFRKPMGCAVTTTAHPTEPQPLPFQTPFRCISVASSDSSDASISSVESTDSQDIVQYGEWALEHEPRCPTSHDQKRYASRPRRNAVAGIVVPATVLRIGDPPRWQSARPPIPSVR